MQYENNPNYFLDLDTPCTKEGHKPYRYKSSSGCVDCVKARSELQHFQITGRIKGEKKPKKEKPVRVKGTKTVKVKHYWIKPVHSKALLRLQSGEVVEYKEEPRVSSPEASVFDLRKKTITEIKERLK